MTLPSDANDLAALRGLRAVADLVDSAKSIEPAVPADGAADANVVGIEVARRAQRQAAAEAPDASHHVLAHAWCDSRSLGAFRPVYTNGAFYVPGADGRWHRLSAEAVQVEVAEMFPGRKLCRKNSDFKQITEHISALCEVEGFFDEAPAGVASAAGFHMMSPQGVQTMPLALSHRQTSVLPYCPDFAAEAPLMSSVLGAAFEGHDPEGQTDLWWQAFGAAVFGIMPTLQVVLFMVGRPRSGKSLLQRVLEGMFPASAVCAIPPASWGHEYHSAGMAGKKLNLVGELPDDSPIPAAAFKNVTGQNLIWARHPTHRPFCYRCTASHILAANAMPPMSDKSGGVERRSRVLYFANSVPAERADPGLYEKIVASEMPAILAEAFRGAERVARTGSIRTTQVHTAMLERWRLAANPLQQFLADDEWVELDPEERTHTPASVYEAYRRWAASTGFRNPFGRNHFLELLESTGAARGIAIKRVGTRSVVVGLRLLDRP